jgi:hypothetical protein
MTSKYGIRGSGSRWEFQFTLSGIPASVSPQNASYLGAALGRREIDKTAGFRRVVLSLEAGGADVLWPPNEQQDTIGHEENGYLAHQLADYGASPNVEKVACACIGARAPSS